MRDLTQTWNDGYQKQQIYRAATANPTPSSLPRPRVLAPERHSHPPTRRLKRRIQHPPKVHPCIHPTRALPSPIHLLPNPNPAQQDGIKRVLRKRPITVRRFLWSVVRNRVPDVDDRVAHALRNVPESLVVERRVWRLAFPTRGVRSTVLGFFGEEGAEELDATRGDGGGFGESFELFESGMDFVTLVGDVFRGVGSGGLEDVEDESRRGGDGVVGAGPDLKREVSERIEAAREGRTCWNGSEDPLVSC